MIPKGIVQNIEERLKDCRDNSREIESKNRQLCTIIQKKKILIRTDFGATFLIQIITRVWRMHGRLARLRMEKGT